MNNYFKMNIGNANILNKLNHQALLNPKDNYEILNNIIYIYIGECVCVCVCVCILPSVYTSPSVVRSGPNLAHTCRFT